MTRRKREHDGLHDVKVAAAAIATLAAIFILSELTDTDTPAPQPPADTAPDLSDRHEVAQTVSRSDPRAAPAAPSHARGGAHSDTSGRSEDAGKRQLSRPVVGQTWAALAECESGGDWHINTGNGYYGGLQFTIQSWQGVGGHGYPHEASVAEQIRRAEILQDIQGWGAWPTCSQIVGLS